MDRIERKSSVVYHVTLAMALAMKRLRKVSKTEGGRLARRVTHGAAHLDQL